ncbi:hypothetical protein [Streptomyces violarus]|uniref:hypothetical protein n=1 Tax=Streptomyces violarus TaxID=67380 RepID=UPI0021C07C15|nr:hypothetical protein [Streptomyces violarus]MCT9138951.1 hypothetical protein [Streptomyces violarus]
MPAFTARISPARSPAWKREPASRTTSSSATRQPDVRAQVIERVLAALAAACGLEKPSPTRWVDFRVIDEGSWGSFGGVLSVLPLLDSGVFTEERAKAVRAALGV